MTTTFMCAPQLFLTSESVTEGHPDKLCDQVSDGILDAIYAQDPYGRVACETATTTGLVVVLGEITTSARFDAQKIVRDTIAIFALWSRRFHSRRNTTFTSSNFICFIWAGI